MSKYFGTDGFRGEAGITLTADHAYKVGRFLGWYYNALRERNGNNEPARIVIGKDTRRSSYMFEYSLVAGLTASGADAYLLHVTTTPSVAYVLILNGQKLVQGMQVHKQLMLQIMSKCIAAHHLLCLFVQLAIDKDQWLIKIE